MNFRLSTLFYSFISLVVALFFVIIGIVSFILPWFPEVRMTLATFIMEDSITIFLFGSCFLVIGAATIAGICWSTKRKYYHLKAGPQAISLSDTLFHDYLISYWKEVFPKSEVPCSVKLKKNKIHITADLPYVPRQEQKKLLQQMELDITEIFTRLLGYRSEYHFFVSFKERT